MADGFSGSASPRCANPVQSASANAFSWSGGTGNHRMGQKGRRRCPTLPRCISTSELWLVDPSTRENATERPSCGPSMYCRKRSPSKSRTPDTPASRLKRAASSIKASSFVFPVPAPHPATTGLALLTYTTALMGIFPPNTVPPARRQRSISLAPASNVYSLWSAMSARATEPKNETFLLTGSCRWPVSIVNSPCLNPLHCVPVPLMRASTLGCLPLNVPANRRG